MIIHLKGDPADIQHRFRCPQCEGTFILEDYEETPKRCPWGCDPHDDEPNEGRDWAQVAIDEGRI